MKSRTVSGSNGKRYTYKSELRESDIQKQILDWLKLHRIFHYRQNVGAQKIGSRFVRYGLPGLPDIICVVKGTYIGLEVKVSKNEQSIVQIQFETELKRAGGRYYVVHNLGEAIECLAKL